MKTALSCVTLCSLILLSGCLGGVSATPQFFTLQNESNISVVSNQKISVGVLPVKVPDYLDKPQIVLNNGTNQMTISETNRWIEPLSSVAQQTLINDIQKMLPNAFVKTKGYDDDNYNRIVRVEIDKMSGTLGKEARLSVWWSILNHNGKEIYRTRFADTEQIHNSYESYTQGQSILWAKLSNQIAQHLTSYK